jgi:hypothetical protein
MCLHSERSEIVDKLQGERVPVNELVAMLGTHYIQDTVEAMHPLCTQGCIAPQQSILIGIATVSVQYSPAGAAQVRVVHAHGIVLVDAAYMGYIEPYDLGPRIHFLQVLSSEMNRFRKK